MRVTTSIAIFTAGLASLAASQNFDEYDRCADAVFNDPNLKTCTSNPGASGLACFCTSDITAHELTDATIALCARNHFPVESLKHLICNPNTQISTSDRKHSSSPMVRLASDSDAHHARALPVSTIDTDIDSTQEEEEDDDDEDENEQPRSVIYQVITETSTSCNCESTPAPAAGAASHAPSGVSPQRGSATQSSSDILVHTTPSTSATGASGSEKVLATSSAIMPSGTDSSDGEGEHHGMLFQGVAGRGVSYSLGGVVGGLVVGILGVLV